jgi:dienelactone hydrolase
MRGVRPARRLESYRRSIGIRSRVEAWCLVAFLLGIGFTGRAQTPGRRDALFNEFWKAEDRRAAERVAGRLLATDIAFDEAWRRLQAGRPYGTEKTGEFSMRFPAGAGLMFDNTVEVPAAYSPDRPWMLRVQLHGGVNRPAEQTMAAASLEEDEATTGGRAPSLGRRRRENRIPGEPQIYVFPSGSASATWWHGHQVENILRVVDRLKRRYNIDESRIYLTGISDGGTGAYYMAMKDPTVWSAFLPLNGSIKVLGNPAVRADGELYAGNLVNRPFYIVNGGRDPLYAATHVATHVEAFKRLGVSLVFRPQAEAGHDTSWWTHERGLYEQFVKQRPREPQPARLSWETERTDRFNRVDWLVIDALGRGSRDATFEPLDLFEHKRPSGRVDIERRGNTFEARTRGVRSFTLLLSPDAVDLDRPIAVVVNGALAFEGLVRRDARVLLTWAARDADRTRLYAAAVTVQVP